MGDSLDEFTAEQICRTAKIQPCMLDGWYNSGKNVIVVLNTGSRFGVSKNAIYADMRIAGERSNAQLEEDRRNEHPRT